MSQLEQTGQSMAAGLDRLVRGYQISQAIHVAATLGIADLLQDGPRSSDELAAAAGADLDTLYRLLRALAAVGVFREEEGRRFALTPLGDRLRSDLPDSAGPWATFLGRPYHWQAWGSLLHSVRTGENAFRHVHGMDAWQYRAEHPDESALFDRTQTVNSRRVSDPILDAYDLSRFGCVVDVAGGQGALLAAILRKHPAVQGVLFDQPHVVAAGEETFRAAGVTDRCRVVEGSFFDTVPAGGDAYILKSILHDWEDAEATAILTACRRAMVPGSTLLVIERVLGPPNEDAGGAFSDLNMLVGPGGRERTRQEFEDLLSASGFRLVDVVPTRSAMSVLEAVPAPSS